MWRRLSSGSVTALVGHSATASSTKPLYFSNQTDFAAQTATTVVASCYNASTATTSGVVRKRAKRSKAVVPPVSPAQEEDKKSLEVLCHVINVCQRHDAKYGNDASTGFTLNITATMVADAKSKDSIVPVTSPLQLLNIIIGASRVSSRASDEQTESTDVMKAQALFQLWMVQTLDSYHDTTNSTPVATTSKQVNKKTKTKSTTTDVTAATGRSAPQDIAELVQCLGILLSRGRTGYSYSAKLHVCSVFARAFERLTASYTITTGNTLATPEDEAGSVYNDKFFANICAPEVMDALTNWIQPYDLGQYKLLLSIVLNGSGLKDPVVSAKDIERIVCSLLAHHASPVMLLASPFISTLQPQKVLVFLNCVTQYCVRNAELIWFGSSSSFNNDGSKVSSEALGDITLLRSHQEESATSTLLPPITKEVMSHLQRHWSTRRTVSAIANISNMSPITHEQRLQLILNMILHGHLQELTGFTHCHVADMQFRIREQHNTAGEQHPRVYYVETCKAIVELHSGLVELLSCIKKSCGLFAEGKEETDDNYTTTSAIGENRRMLTPTQRKRIIREMELIQERCRKGLAVALNVYAAFLFELNGKLQLRLREHAVAAEMQKVYEEVLQSIQPYVVPVAGAAVAASVVPSTISHLAPLLIRSIQATALPYENTKRQLAHDEHCLLTTRWILGGLEAILKGVHQSMVGSTLILHSGNKGVGGKNSSGNTSINSKNDSADGNASFDNTGDTTICTHDALASLGIDSPFLPPRTTRNMVLDLIVDGLLRPYFALTSENPVVNILQQCATPGGIIIGVHGAPVASSGTGGRGTEAEWNEYDASHQDAFRISVLQRLRGEEVLTLVSSLGMLERLLPVDIEKPFLSRLKRLLLPAFLASYSTQFAATSVSQVKKIKGKEEKKKGAKKGKGKKGGPVPPEARDSDIHAAKYALVKEALYLADAASVFLPISITTAKHGPTANSNTTPTADDANSTAGSTDINSNSQPNNFSVSRGELVTLIQQRLPSLISRTAALIEGVAEGVASPTPGDKLTLKDEVVVLQRAVQNVLGSLLLRLVRVCCTAETNILNDDNDVSVSNDNAESLAGDLPALSSAVEQCLSLFLAPSEHTSFGSVTPPFFADNAALLVFVQQLQDAVSVSTAASSSSDNSNTIPSPPDAPNAKGTSRSRGSSTAQLVEGYATTIVDKLCTVNEMVSLDTPNSKGSSVSSTSEQVLLQQALHHTLSRFYHSVTSGSNSSKLRELEQTATHLARIVSSISPYGQFPVMVRLSVLRSLGLLSRVRTLLNSTSQKADSLKDSFIPSMVSLCNTIYAQRHILPSAEIAATVYEIATAFSSDASEERERALRAMIPVVIQSRDYFVPMECVTCLRAFVISKVNHPTCFGTLLQRIQDLRPYFDLEAVVTLVDCGALAGSLGLEGLQKSCFAAAHPILRSVVTTLLEASHGTVITNGGGIAFESPSPGREGDVVTYSSSDIPVIILQTLTRACPTDSISDQTLLLLTDHINEVSLPTLLAALELLVVKQGVADARIVNTLRDHCVQVVLPSPVLTPRVWAVIQLARALVLCGVRGRELFNILEKRLSDVGATTPKTAVSASSKKGKSKTPTMTSDTVIEVGAEPVLPLSPRDVTSLCQIYAEAREEGLDVLRNILLLNVPTIAPQLIDPAVISSIMTGSQNAGPAPIAIVTGVVHSAFHDATTPHELQQRAILVRHLVAAAANVVSLMRFPDLRLLLTTLAATVTVDVPSSAPSTDAFIHGVVTRLANPTSVLPDVSVSVLILASLLRLGVGSTGEKKSKKNTDTRDNKGEREAVQRLCEFVFTGRQQLLTRQTLCGELQRAMATNPSVIQEVYPPLHQFMERMK